MLPWLCYQTSYEFTCFGSGYQRLSNMEAVHTRETVPAELCQKKIDLMIIFALLGALSLAQGYHLCRPPIPEYSISNPDQAPHCRWTLSHGCRYTVHRSCDAIFVSRMLQSLHVQSTSHPNAPSSHSISRCLLNKVLSSRHRICGSSALLC